MAPRDHLWSYLPKLYFSKFGNDFYIVKSTVTSKKMFPLLKTIPEFYQDVILSYKKSKIMSYEDFRVSIKNQPIWCNKYIKFEGKTVLFKSWIEDGIVMLKNFRLNNGILDVIQFICILESQVVECSIGSFYTQILEVNLFAFAYRLFHRDFSPLNGAFCIGTHCKKPR